MRTPSAAYLSTWTNTSSSSVPCVSQQKTVVRWRPLPTPNRLTSSSSVVVNSVRALPLVTTANLDPTETGSTSSMSTIVYSYRSARSCATYRRSSRTPTSSRPPKSPRTLWACSRPKTGRYGLVCATRSHVTAPMPHASTSSTARCSSCA